MCLRIERWAAGFLAGMISGCSQGWREAWDWNLAGNDVLVTTAAVRGVYSTPVATDGFGRIEPSRVLCAEPSPDVASAISSGLGAALTAAAQEPGGPEGAVSGSFASSRAQSIAQLGERLATMQLLRDGLYRACEAYANGAVTPATYTLIVSRIDDLMVTLLSTEIAGGAFGRELAALGGSATGAAAASQAVGGASEKATQLTGEVKEAEAKVAAQKQELGELEGQKTATTGEGSEEPHAALDGQIEEQQGKVQTAEEERNKKQEELLKAVTELAVAQATSALSSARATLRGGWRRGPGADG
jgi:hypothetical protein